MMNVQETFFHTFPRKYSSSSSHNNQQRKQPQNNSSSLAVAYDAAEAIASAHTPPLVYSSQHNIMYQQHRYCSIGGGCSDYGEVCPQCFYADDENRAAVENAVEDSGKIPAKIETAAATFIQQSAVEKAALSKTVVDGEDKEVYLDNGKTNKQADDNGNANYSSHSGLKFCRKNSLTKCHQISKIMVCRNNEDFSQPGASGSSRQRKAYKQANSSRKFDSSQQIVCRNNTNAKDDVYYSHSKEMKNGFTASGNDRSGDERISLASTIIEDADELNDLPETNVDSENEDEEEEDCDEDSCPSGESLMELRDAVRECLEKDPADRTADDVHILTEFMQHMPAFASLPVCLKHELCGKLVFALVEHANTVILHDGEQLDSWCVIINGEIEITYADGSPKTELHLGDSFGIEPRPEPQQHKGEMRTLVDDCQFVLITQRDYVDILSKMSSNVLQHRDAYGEIVSETERRSIENKEYYVLIKAKPDRLLDALLDDKDIVSSDPYYVEDFLLMRRAFLPNAVEVFETFLRWFSELNLKEKVARLVLLWVNNHFCDFECDSKMMNLLAYFGRQLDKEGMANHRQLLNIACSVKSRPRTLIYARSNRDEILHFNILGGQDKLSYGIYVSQVEENSAAEKIGLKRGDQILEVNGNSFLRVSHQRALEILRGSTHLSIVVKSNLLGLKEMLENNLDRPVFAGFNAGPPSPLKSIGAPAGVTTAHRHKSADFTNAPNLAVKLQQRNNGISNQQRQRYPPGPVVLHHAHSYSDAKTLKVAPIFKHSSAQSPKFGNAKSPEKELINKISRLLKKFTLGGKDEDDHNNNNNYKMPMKPAPVTQAMLKHSRSNPDLSVHNIGGLSQYYQPTPARCPEHVLKIYRSDQSYKYLSVYKETTAQNVVQLALQEFGMACISGVSSLEWTLCEVSASDGAIKQKRLPDQMQNLAEKISLNSRYYLKNLRSTEPLVPDELITELNKDSAAINFLQLNASNLAAQLTLQDFALFSSIQPTDYVEDLFKSTASIDKNQKKFNNDVSSSLKMNSQQSSRNPGSTLTLENDRSIGQQTSKLNQFEQVVNKEMWWVVTEICRERNIFRRVKIIKKFIKIARRCRDFRNFNSMFAIMSGLEKPAVKRLHSSWDKISGKYQKMFNDLQTLLDPSRNMSKYRQHLHKTANESPCAIPLFPLVRKDLYFIHECNRTWSDGLVNFEKLRMISKEIRAITRLSSVPYDLSTMSVQSGYSKNLTGALLHMNSFERGSTVATMRKHHTNKAAACSRKKLYEQALMVRRCKAYLQSMAVIDDEHELDRLSFECEPQSQNGCPHSHAVKWPLGSRSTSSCGSSASLNSEKSRVTSCAFGVESPQAVQKMLALVDHSRMKSPVAGRNQRNCGGVSVVDPSGAPLSPVCSRLHKFRYRSRSDIKEISTEPVKPVNLTVESSSVTSFAPFYDGKGGGAQAFLGPSSYQTDNNYLNCGGLLSNCSADSGDSGRGSNDSNSTGSQESPSLGQRNRHHHQYHHNHTHKRFFNRLAKIPQFSAYSAAASRFVQPESKKVKGQKYAAESDDERSYLMNSESYSDRFDDQRNHFYAHSHNDQSSAAVNNRMMNHLYQLPNLPPGLKRIRRTNSNPSEKFGEARTLFYNTFYEEEPTNLYEQVSRV